jgi:hypothetical protein
VYNTGIAGKVDTSVYNAGVAALSTSVAAKVCVRGFEPHVWPLSNTFCFSWTRQCTTRAFPPRSTRRSTAHPLRLSAQASLPRSVCLSLCVCVCVCVCGTVIRLRNVFANEQDLHRSTRRSSPLRLQRSAPWTQPRFASLHVLAQTLCFSDTSTVPAAERHGVHHGHRRQGRHFRLQRRSHSSQHVGGRQGLCARCVVDDVWPLSNTFCFSWTRQCTTRAWPARSTRRSTARSLRLSAQASLPRSVCLSVCVCVCVCVWSGDTIAQRVR